MAQIAFLKLYSARLQIFCIWCAWLETTPVVPRTMSSVRVLEYWRECAILLCKLCAIVDRQHKLLLWLAIISQQKPDWPLIICIKTLHAFYQLLVVGQHGCNRSQGYRVPLFGGSHQHVMVVVSRLTCKRSHYNTVCLMSISVFGTLACCNSNTWLGCVT